LNLSKEHNAPNFFARRRALFFVVIADVVGVENFDAWRIALEPSARRWVTDAVAALGSQQEDDHAVV